jgi:predicted PurR-regulated permease PerM
MKYNEKATSIIKYLILIAVLVIVVKYSESIKGQLGYIGKASLPLVTGLVVAYILNILMKKLENVYFPKSKKQIVKDTRRNVCIVLSILIIIGIIVIVALIVVPEVLKAASVIIASIPVVLQNMEDLFTNNSDKYEIIQKGLDTMQIDINSISKNLMTAATGVLTSIMNSLFSFVSSFTSGLLNFVIALTFAIYVLANKERLARQIRRIMKAFLKPKTIEKIDYVFHITNDAFSNFIIGQCVEAVILGGLCTIGMFIFRFPYAVTVGAFISATALIPVVGAYLGAALGAFMILTVSPIKALLFIVFISVLQQLENNLIYPRVVGSSIGLPGIWVFAAITIGAGLGGVVGMLLSVPVAASFYKIFSDNVNNRLGEQEVKATMENTAEEE